MILTFETELVGEWASSDLQNWRMKFASVLQRGMAMCEKWLFYNRIARPRAREAPHDNVFY